ncbi:MAG: replication and repair protein RecF protein [Candidatus Collierbacteria bacterium GW2011_GWB1_44_6]|uniref:DNA replication and repair protein RecF n=2 Tax=Candidatus Collieribacteriota TaxID=1752725 RepID=A0A0G1MLQ5_9BACT|nr:MAG: replication and repair protein RecF protein [Candidatus Collierbacteria bacterium GW2011_GWC2_43_12]KKT72959.1 MAG: replication and repair protein RecF protein [Candidatus Collierbacteria bacterium GW2011_GWB1_44_6]KKT83648.1 MAG: replication and repair protein RecF protein [Microgenomates group bacterium GW2011_GWC1_44_9]
MLTKLRLSGFRNYTEAEYDFSQGVNAVIGQNAKGKTNLLEAIYLLGVGESFRAKRTEEMVSFGQELGKVAGEIQLSKDDTMTLEVMVNGGVVMGKTVNKRKYLVDGVSKRRKDILGLMPLVLFRPEDVELISGSPDSRRKFLDNLLIQVDKVYENSLSTYEQALRRRNKLLDAIREGTASRYALTFWDGLLIKHGQLVTEKRRELVEYINRLFKKSDLFKDLEVVYDMSTVSEARLSQYKEAEVAVGYTLVGPHKDDMLVKDKSRDLSTYGSRGEQRMAVLALKMGEIYFMEEQSGKKVLLLLDDIFSELDEVHKEEVLRVMSGRQVVVTTADEGDSKMFKGAKVVRLT